MTTRSILFEKTVDFLIDEIEGIQETNYVNDRGGQTKFGITKKTFPHIDISALTRAEAIELYYRFYWLPFHVDELPPALGIFIFDCAVNHRPRTGARLLQQALRSGLRCDGIIGSKTIAAAKQSHSYTVLTEVLALRADLYHDLVLANNSQAKFLVGWFARLFKLQGFILKLQAK